MRFLEEMASYPTYDVDELFIPHWKCSAKTKKEAPVNDIPPFPLAVIQSRPLLKILKKLDLFDFHQIYGTSRWVKEFIDENRVALVKDCPMDMELVISELIGKSDEDLVFHLCKDYQYLHLQTIIFSQCRFTSQYEEMISRLFNIFNKHHITARGLHIGECGSHPEAIKLLKLKKYSWVAPKTTEWTPVVFPYKMNKISMGNLALDIFDYCVRNYIEKTSFLGLRMNFEEHPPAERLLEWMEFTIKTLSKLKSERLVCLTGMFLPMQTRVEKVFPSGLFHFQDRLTQRYFLITTADEGVIASIMDIGPPNIISHFYAQYIVSLKEFVKFYDNIQHIRRFDEEDRKIIELVRLRYFRDTA